MAEISVFSSDCLGALIIEVQLGSELKNSVTKYFIF